MIKQIFTLMALALTLTACGGGDASAKGAADNALQTSKNTETMTDTTTQTAAPDSFVLLKTTLGDITVRLFGDTPRHQANFLKLVKEGYYNNVLFHRVIDQFMVQTGDPDSRNAKQGQMLGSGGPDYTMPAEIVYPRHFHKRGALAAARQGDQVNPERRSSGSQFYIVTGKQVTPAEMQAVERQYGFAAKQNEFNRLAQSHMDSIRAWQATGQTDKLKALQQQLIEQTEAKFANQPEAKLPAEVSQAYTTVGGTPHLDQQYTVFGEVVSGMDVVAKIEKAQTDSSDRPLEDIRIISATVVDAPKSK